MDKPAEEFTGRSGELRVSQWLASEDIMDLGDVVVEIEKVWRHNEITFEEGRTERLVPTIQFKGKQKQLVLNSKNRRTLAALLGPDTKSWPGQRIALYVDKDVKLFGKRTCGIRIRPEKPKATK